MANQTHALASPNREAPLLHLPRGGRLNALKNGFYLVIVIDALKLAG